VAPVLKKRLRAPRLAGHILNMKLINPSETEINNAVAEYVAGWQKSGFGGWVAPGEYHESKSCFTRSADAVTNLLEEGRVNGRQVQAFMGFKRWQIWIHDKGLDGFYSSADRPADGDAPTFAMAGCLALLRSRGISVEFTGEGRT